MIAPDDERGMDALDGSSIDVMTPLPYATDDMPVQDLRSAKTKVRTCIIVVALSYTHMKTFDVDWMPMNPRSRRVFTLSERKRPTMFLSPKLQTRDRFQFGSTTNENQILLFVFIFLLSCFFFFLLLLHVMVSFSIVHGS